MVGLIDKTRSETYVEVRPNGKRNFGLGARLRLNIDKGENES